MRLHYWILLNIQHVFTRSVLQRESTPKTKQLSVCKSYLQAGLTKRLCLNWVVHWSNAFLEIYWTPIWPLVGLQLSYVQPKTRLADRKTSVDQSVFLVSLFHTNRLKSCTFEMVRLKLLSNSSFYSGYDWERLLNNNFHKISVISIKKDVFSSCIF